MKNAEPQSQANWKEFLDGLTHWVSNFVSELKIDKEADLRQKTDVILCRLFWFKNNLAIFFENYTKLL